MDVIGSVVRILRGPSEEEDIAAEQAKIDSQLKSTEELYEARAERLEAKGEGWKGGPADRQVAKLTVQVESLKAQLEVVKAYRDASNERFLRLAEQIGEVRAMMLQQEKETARVSSHAEKAASLIASVQPDRLLGEVQKAQLKVDSAVARIDRMDATYFPLAAEVRMMKSKVTAYGMAEETLMKLQSEVKSDLAEISKAESGLSRHAGKVEAVYAEITRKTADFERTAAVVQRMQKEMDQLRRDYDALKIRYDGLADTGRVEELEVQAAARMRQLDDIRRKSNRALQAFLASRESFGKRFAGKLDDLRSETRKEFKSLRSGLLERREESRAKII